MDLIWSERCVSLDAVIHSQDPHQQLLLNSPDWKSIIEFCLNKDRLFLKFNMMNKKFI